MKKGQFELLEDNEIIQTQAKVKSENYPNTVSENGLVSNLNNLDNRRYNNLTNGKAVEFEFDNIEDNEGIKMQIEVKEFETENQSKSFSRQGLVSESKNTDDITHSYLDDRKVGEYEFDSLSGHESIQMQDEVKEVKTANPPSLSKETVHPMKMDKEPIKRNMAKKSVYGNLTIQKECPECSINVINLKDHLKIQHKHDEQQICSDCGKEFKNKKYLRNHERIVHTQKLQCNICAIEVKDLKSHMNSVHNKGDLRQHKCDQCEKMFKSKKNLNTHKLVAHIFEPKKCSLCPTILKNDYMNKCHLRKVHGE